ncbi:Glucose oxidase [Grifola frondosa]|uniref:Glucose oxidase n=1 Tax=Grifola frondosa TaxID=5627 RepID=A0A1C7M9J3_GRIFR|nr:Glucose oxidase [Grifola frondosa]
MSAKLDDVAGKSFDYIIIGGGTAGLALAARLSEDPSISVLVSRGRGQPQRQRQPPPDAAPQAAEQPQVRLGVQDSRAAAFEQPHVRVAAGEGPRGSSAINFMLWNKPAREYVQAFELLGNPGWTWELFDKYSKRAEKFIPPDHDTDVLTYDLAYRGRTGAIITSFPSVISNLERPLIQAMKKLGIEHILDSSSGFTNGSCVTASTLDPRLTRAATPATCISPPRPRALTSSCSSPPTSRAS